MIRELAIISGKGGTGKTSISASLACLARGKVIAECDVDAADMHLVLRPTILKRAPFDGGFKASINREACSNCGLCIRYCRFDAIRDNLTVDSLACEGCNVCAHLCPAGAIEMVKHVSGEWFVSETAQGPMVHAKLGIAEGNSGKLVTLLKRQAREIAQKNGLDLIIVDGSPGTGCPVIATITGSTNALVVTEPTVAGVHDLKRALELTRHFRVKTGVCINKADINPEKKDVINILCKTEGVPVYGEIPYDEDITRAQIEGMSVVEYSNGPAASSIKKMWEKIKNDLS